MPGARPARLPLVEACSPPGGLLGAADALQPAVADPLKAAAARNTQARRRAPGPASANFC